MGDGRKVKFWEDIWCEERALKQDYPDVFDFDLAMDPFSLVTDFSVCVREDCEESGSQKESV